MTEQPGQQPAGGTHRHGRHYRDGPRRSRAVTTIAVVIAIAVVAGLGSWLVRSQATADSKTAATDTAVVSDATNSTSQVTGTTCPLPGGILTVAASPEIADVLAALSQPGAVIADPAGCTVAVTPVDPAAVVANGPSGADVWIPDSSMWIERAAAAGLVTSGQNPSVATSEVVLALSKAAAGRLAATGGPPDLSRILATRQTANPIRVGLPDLQKSAAAVGIMLAARAGVAGTPDARAALTWAVRSSPADLPTDAKELIDRLPADPNTAMPVSERAIVAHNATATETPVVAAYPGSGGVALDYPVVTLSSDPGVVSATADLARLLVGEQGRAALQAAGFRAPDGSAGSTMSPSLGVNPAARVTAPMPSLAAIDDAVRTVQVTNEPSRMLAVMDISGSMQAEVAGASPATRMDLAKQAAIRGLGMYSADSDIGLWVFSRSLTPTSDHRELIPVSTLGPDGRGWSGARRLAQALDSIQAIPDGGTGLYDTVLDAVRTMRAAYDPTRVNAVLIMSDGMNDDAGSIDLNTLLSTLAAEQDPTRPVPVISIAFGPDSDVQALSQISKATGGAEYESRDPRQIGEIFLDAVGQRLCRPSC